MPRPQIPVRGRNSQNNRLRDRTSHQQNNNRNNNNNNGNSSRSNNNRSNNNNNRSNNNRSSNYRSNNDRSNNNRSNNQTDNRRINRNINDNQNNHNQKIGNNNGSIRNKNNRRVRHGRLPVMDADVVMTSGNITTTNDRCYNCNARAGSHLYVDCRRKCGNCNEPGHLRRECDKEHYCKYCNNTTHNTVACLKCKYCGINFDHKSDACRNEVAKANWLRINENKFCLKCNLQAHTIDECLNPSTNWMAAPDLVSAVIPTIDFGHRSQGLPLPPLKKRKGILLNNGPIEQAARLMAEPQQNMFTTSAFARRLRMSSLSARQKLHRRELEGNKHSYCKYCNAPNHASVHCRNNLRQIAWNASRDVCDRCKVRGHTTDHCQNPNAGSDPGCGTVDEDTYRWLNPDLIRGSFKRGAHPGQRKREFLEDDEEAEDVDAPSDPFDPNEKTRPKRPLKRTKVENFPLDFTQAAYKKMSKMATLRQTNFLLTANIAEKTATDRHALRCLNCRTKAYVVDADADTLMVDSDYHVSGMLNTNPRKTCLEIKCGCYAFEGLSWEEHSPVQLTGWA